MHRPRLALWLVVLLALAACGPSAGPDRGAAPAPSGARQSAQPKTVVMAMAAEPTALSPLQLPGTGYQGPIYQMVHDFLVVHDHEGEPHSHLAAAVPSVDRGSWQVFPDGTMETTWRLREGARWHDGTEFTSRDVAFSWRMAYHPEVPWSRPEYARRIREVTTPDPYTVVMHWKETFPFADRPEETTLDPLPAHVLEPLVAPDVQAFLNAPHWTREFIGLGPYRVASWAEGSHLELRSIETHYAGRAKIDAITVRFIPDANTLMANLLSGSVEVNMPPTTLTNQHWNTIRQQGRDSEVIYDRQGTLRFVGPNHRVPPFGEVPARRALAHALDREAVADALYIPRTQITDAMVVPGSEKASRLRPRIHAYPYDPAQALANLEQVGWRRGADGLVRNAGGQPLEFELRGEQGGEQTSATVIAEMLKAIGVGVNLMIPTPALTRDLEWVSNVKGAEIGGFGISFGMWERRMHTRAIPVPENRLAGTNRRYFSNPEVDALIERLMVTLDAGQRERIEGDLLEAVTRDAVIAPLDVDAPAAVVRKGITGPKSMAGSTVLVSRYYGTWNILEWDVN